MIQIKGWEGFSEYLEELLTTEDPAYCLVLQTGFCVAGTSRDTEFERNDEVKSGWPGSHLTKIMNSKMMPTNWKISN